MPAEGRASMQNEEHPIANVRTSHNAMVADSSAETANRRKTSGMCSMGCNMLTLPSKGKTVRFICPPRQRKRWDDPHEHPHVNWGDLFFDLFYVGLAYSLAILIKDSPTKLGVLYFAGCFGPVMMEWIERTWFDSRFSIEDDLFHRTFEVGQLCLLATAVLHIGTVKTMANPDKSVEMFAFSLSVSLMVLCTILRYVEVWMWVEGEPEAKVEAKRHIRNKALTLPFYIAAAAISGSRYQGSKNSIAADGITRRVLADDEPSYPATEDNSVHTPIYLCLAGWAMSNILLFTQLLLWKKKKVDHKAVSVPMNVDFIIHRNGEWIMLLLGESILSLIISTIDEKREFYVTFYAGVLSTIVLKYLHYRSQPHNGDQHALQRSKPRALSFTFLMQVYSGALVMLGASFKMLLYEHSYNNYDKGQEGHDNGNAGHRLLTATMADLSLSDEEASRFLAGGDGMVPDGGEDKRAYNTARFYCVSMAVMLLCLELMIISHKGLRNNLKRCLDPETKHILWISVVYFVFRIVLIAFIATLFINVSEPEGVAFIGLACLLVEVFMRIVGDLIFLDPEVQDAASHLVGRRGVEHDNDDSVIHASLAPSSNEVHQPVQDCEEAACGSRAGTGPEDAPVNQANTIYLQAKAFL